MTNNMDKIKNTTEMEDVKTLMRLRLMHEA